MTSTTGRPAPGEEKEIDLLDLLATLWAGKYIVAAVVFLSLVHGAFTVLKTQPMYQADGVLQLESRPGALALPLGMQNLASSSYFSGNSAGETEMTIMRSRMVMQRAADRLDLRLYVQPRPLPWLGILPRRLGLPDPGLAILRPYQWGKESLSVGALEAPPDWNGAPVVLTVTGADGFEVTLPDESRHPGRVRQRLAVPEQGFSILVDAIDAPPGREFLVGRMPEESAAFLAMGGFSVMQSEPYSSILNVSYVADDPEKARRILDAIMQAYVEQNVMRSSAEAQNSLDFIEEQLPLSERSVTEAQAALNAYRQKQQSVDVDYETRSLLERATQIEAELSKLSLEEEELKKRYTVNHPTYQSLLENRALLERQLAQVRQETQGLPETQKEIFNLTRNLEVAQQVYVQLLNRAQELRVMRASAVGSVRIIDTAWSSGLRISPRTSQALMKSFVIGALLGIAIVMARRFLRRGIRGAEEIERAGLPVFGTLNYAPEAANHRKRRGVLPIHALVRPDDMVVEALRSLRTALHFGMLDAKTRTVLLTSAAPGAGKSFTAVNLAVVAAQAGQKVCLIDADLRRGYLRRYFGKDKTAPGLADYLARTKTLEEVLLPGPIDGLSVILTGRFPPNPSELLMRAEFEELLKLLDTRFDLILIDSPPALAVTDPVVIGRYAGATIMVVRHLETMAGEIEAVRRAFETAGSKLTGAVLNGYRQEQGSKYGGYHHYYNYRYSYRSDRE